jgi:hypothetical protein
MMCPAINNPTSCKICAITFLEAEIMSAAEIHCELRAAVYGQHVMSQVTLRQWCRMFKGGRANRFSLRRIKWSAI